MMVKFILVYGTQILNKKKDTVYKFGQMDQSMRVTGLQIWLQVEVDLSLQMVICTKGTGSTTKLTEMEAISMPKELFTKEDG